MVTDERNPTPKLYGQGDGSEESGVCVCGANILVARTAVYTSRYDNTQQLG